VRLMEFMGEKPRSEDRVGSRGARDARPLLTLFSRHSILTENRGWVKPRPVRSSPPARALGPRDYDAWPLFTRRFALPAGRCPFRRSRNLIYCKHTLCQRGIVKSELLFRHSGPPFACLVADT
jgi:hypothetical protein